MSQDLVKLMKEIAKENPHDPTKGAAPKECLWQNISFEEEKLDLMLTYDLLGGGKAWHLSICRSNRTAAPQEIVDHIVGVVLGSDAQIISEIFFPPEFRYIKQFAKMID